jgi:hypothetical protein
MDDFLSRWDHEGRIPYQLFNKGVKVMGYFKLSSANPQSADAAGQAIIKVSETVYKPGPSSEWVSFVTDTKKWIFDRGYFYHKDDDSLSPAQGPGKPAGYTPDDVEIVPVYDSEKRMHVRVPWHGALAQINNDDIPNVETYNLVVNKVPVFLARYFMRSCR